MWIPVTCSTVFVSSLAPPSAYEALILLLPLPGMAT